MRTAALRAFAALTLVVFAGCSDSTGSTTTTAPTDVDETSTTTTDPDGSTTTLPATTTVATSTTTTIAPGQASPDCPQDLFVNRPISGLEELGRVDGLLAGHDASGQTIWSIPMGFDIAVDVANDATTAYVYFGSGLLVALDAGSCAERWRVGLGSAGGVGYGEEAVAATDARGVRLFDAATGSLRWTTDLESGPPQSPIVREDFVVVPWSETPVVSGFALFDGEPLYQVSLDDMTGAIDAITSDVSAFYVAGPGSVEARWLDDGTVIWSTPADHEPAGIALVGSRLVVVASAGSDGGGIVTAYDYDTGAVVWEVVLDDPPVAADPAVAHDEVHVLDAGGSLHHLAVDDGESIFVGRYLPGSIMPEFDDDRFVVLQGRELVIYDLLENATTSIRTGADGAARVTTLDLVGDVIVTHTATVAG